MAMQWYVVHTYSGFENRAKLALEDAIRRYGVGDRFGEVLVPTEQVVEVKDGQKRTTRKVYPGYVRPDGSRQRDLARGDLHAQGHGLHRRQPQPAPIPEAEVKRITRQMTEDEDKPKPVVHFERGEEIRIVDGPFATMKGKVEGEPDARRAAGHGEHLRSADLGRARLHPGRAPQLRQRTAAVHGERRTWPRRSSTRSSCRSPRAANPAPPIGPALGAAGVNIPCSARSSTLGRSPRLPRE